MPYLCMVDVSKMPFFACEGIEKSIFGMWSSRKCHFLVCGVYKMCFFRYEFFLNVIFGRG